jgi:hypothetical protein
MGDKSPKSNQKQQAQKNAKATQAGAKKNEAMLAKQVGGNKKK